MRRICVFRGQKAPVLSFWLNSSVTLCIWFPWFNCCCRHASRLDVCSPEQARQSRRAGPGRRQSCRQGVQTERRLPAEGPGQLAGPAPAFAGPARGMWLWRAPGLAAFAAGTSNQHESCRRLSSACVCACWGQWQFLEWSACAQPGSVRDVRCVGARFPPAGGGN